MLVVVVMTCVSSVKVRKQGNINKEKCEAKKKARKVVCQDK